MLTYLKAAFALVLMVGGLSVASIASAGYDVSCNGDAYTKSSACNCHCPDYPQQKFYSTSYNN